MAETCVAVSSCGSLRFPPAVEREVLTSSSCVTQAGAEGVGGPEGDGLRAAGAARPAAAKSSAVRARRDRAGMRVLSPGRGVEGRPAHDPMKARPLPSSGPPAPHPCAVTSPGPHPPPHAPRPGSPVHVRGGARGDGLRRGLPRRPGRAQAVVDLLADRAHGELLRVPAGHPHLAAQCGHRLARQGALEDLLLARSARSARGRPAPAAAPRPARARARPLRSRAVPAGRGGRPAGSAGRSCPRV